VGGWFSQELYGEVRTLIFLLGSEGLVHHILIVVGRGGGRRGGGVRGGVRGGVHVLDGRVISF
jgi:hypothetical protein